MKVMYAAVGDTVTLPRREVQRFGTTLLATSGTIISKSGKRAVVRTTTGELVETSIESLS